jgi:hypothetical protein
MSHPIPQWVTQSHIESPHPTMSHPIPQWVTQSHNESPHSTSSYPIPYWVTPNPHWVTPQPTIAISHYCATSSHNWPTPPPPSPEVYHIRTLKGDPLCRNFKRIMEGRWGVRNIRVSCHVMSCHGWGIIIIFQSGRGYDIRNKICIDPCDTITLIPVHMIGRLWFWEGLLAESPGPAVCPLFLGAAPLAGTALAPPPPSSSGLAAPSSLRGQRHQVRQLMILLRGGGVKENTVGKGDTTTPIIW